ncbi:MAG: Hsp70 family protein [Planctomycetaceae bacterium]|nr:Hsp70 family protein [Planctomycetaceae bacterium]
MAKSSEPAVGIDLGTTYSAVATIENGRPKTLLNEEGELITPSVVFFDRNTAVVGREAIKAAEHEPERLACFAKREMGDAVFHKSICGQQFPPDVIQAIVLEKLYRDAQRHLGPFTKAVVTVPAYFNEPRRKATQDAGRMAGLDVIDIINEPTAAAIAYGVQQGFVDASGQATKHERVLVYDLGGGTFDVTLMDIKGAQFRALATAGDVYLGGVDWDTRIAEHLASVFLNDHKVDLHADSAAWERLMHAASEAKKSLTARDETVVPIAHESKKLKLKLTRAEFESLTADLLDRTRLTVRRLLKEAGLAWKDVTRLLAVGGSTRMPMVGRMLEEESGLKFDRSVSPDEAVAHGAAVYAGMLLKAGGAIDGITVSNVNSHDLGVLGVDPETRRPRRKIMIPRNTALPAQVTKPFKTARDKQDSIKVQVIEGGTDSGSNATAIGTCVINDLPPLPAGTTIQVMFRYGQDGRLAVKASIPSIERDAHLEIERASGIPEDDIVGWADCIRAGLGVPDEG